MPNVYKAGKLHTSGTNIVLNQNNKGVLVVPDTSGSQAGNADVQVKLMGDAGQVSAGGPDGVLLDGSGASVPYVIPVTVHSIVSIGQATPNTVVVELLSTPTSYPVFNTGIVHTYDAKTGTDNFNNTPDRRGKPNKGVLISNTSGATRTRTLVLASTGNTAGDSVQISIPTKTVVIFPIQIYSIDTSDLSGSGNCPIVILH